jgi:CDP-4-dehydro-6-deoxyglucose reductase, E3
MTFVSPLAPSAAQGSAFGVVLRKSELLAPGVRQFTFERTDGADMQFAPGQWVNLLFPVQAEGPGAAGELKRAYSVASAPNLGAMFQLAVTHVEGGPGSTYLHNMPVGGELRALGPHGLFQRRHRKPSIFVGTGTGVTPLRSMFRAALDAGATEPLWLLFGVRKPEDRIYAAEFDALARRHPNFRVIYTLSRATAEWTGRTGYVQTHLRALYDELALQQGLGPHYEAITEEQAADLPAVYICGLTKMINAVRDLLRKDMQLPRTAVHSERYD